MDLRRLRFGDWVMGFGGLAVLVVMFFDWYEAGSGRFRDEDAVIEYAPLEGVSAWQAFAVNDLLIALAAVLALTAFVLTAAHPTAAAPLALGSLAASASLIALALVIVRLVWPPDVAPEVPLLGVDLDDVLGTVRLTGAWLGLVATTLLTAGALASIRDERLPRPARPVEPELVSL